MAFIRHLPAWNCNLKPAFIVRMKNMMVAYIDPGLGQMIWLSIVSAFVGLMFYIKKARAWIADVVLKIFRREDKTITITAPATAKNPATEDEVKIETR